MSSWRIISYVWISPNRLIQRFRSSLYLIFYVQTCFEYIFTVRTASLTRNRSHRRHRCGRRQQLKPFQGKHKKSQRIPVQTQELFLMSHWSTATGSNERLGKSVVATFHHCPQARCLFLKVFQNQCEHLLNDSLHLESRYTEWREDPVCFKVLTVDLST